MKPNVEVRHQVGFTVKGLDGVQVRTQADLHQDGKLASLWNLHYSVGLVVCQIRLTVLTLLEPRLLLVVCLCFSH